MSAQVNIVVHPEVRLHFISRYLYGHFAEHLGRCIYGGIWVGPESRIENECGIRTDTAGALQKLALPVLRWPGGCFADTYHWQDGIGPLHQRPKRTNLWWNQSESNHFGTDEFMRCCRMIGAEPYICLNVGSGTVEEARAWVEYCNGVQDTALVKLRRENGHPDPYTVQFWGIGNENWGCGGAMQPEYYADLYRRFATFVRKTAGEQAKLIACGSHQGIPEWDNRLLDSLKGARHSVDYIALHIYSGQGSSDIHFADEDYYALISAIDVMDQNIKRAAGLTQAYSTADHCIGVVLDEWGTWYREATVLNGLYQQNTMRDALFTAASFHCFHQHGARLYMTNMAQTINVLQALVLTKGPEMIVTPTYHIYDMFRPHRDGYLVASDVDCPRIKVTEDKNRPAVSVSATIAADDQELFLSLVNLDLERPFTANLKIVAEQAWRIKQVRQLAGDDIRSHNSLEEPKKVWPAEIELENTEIQQALCLPRQSVTTIKMGLERI